jgi:adenylate kinase family enzyme
MILVVTGASGAGKTTSVPLSVAATTDAIETEIAALRAPGAEAVQP